jgi:hypothetical protein
MRRLPSLLLAAALTAAGCASQAPEPSGPANTRTFPAPFERVWEAARRVVPDVWGQQVRTADDVNGVLIFNSRLLAVRNSTNPNRRLLAPSQTMSQEVTQELTVYVARGGEGGTRVSLRLDTTADAASAEESTADERLERKILDAIEKDLKK